MILKLIMIMILIFILKDITRYLNKDMPIINKCLLIIAHPDDESMFFSPLIKIHKPHLLLFCYCNEERKKEFKRFCKYKKLKCFIVEQKRNYHEVFKDGMNWDINLMKNIIKDQINKYKYKTVITFDEGGVSGHSNHISCYKAVSELEYEYKSIKFLYLKTVNLFEKYLIFLRRPNLSIRNVLFKNMLFYPSQLKWYRYLWCIFSNYQWFNVFIDKKILT
ncbi:PIGL [Hepatospora eriocheir]|uniref:N-acetylglucosaminylphosphatidylinositol deacetylase n=1 Tax=Hepatospora eriocheir TaxID=1081669 RepID=A0A1X0Q775_9MICR|nr:PIGL [Hepatospora eriocheir]